MATDTEAVIEQKLQQGIELARDGDKSGAEILFDSILSRRPNHEEALLWKAAVSSDIADTIACLERVLRLNPDNQRAKSGLEWARKRLTPPEPTAIEDTPALVEPPAAPSVPVRPISAAKAPAEPETKAADVPYKKSRLPASTTSGSVGIGEKAKAVNVPPSLPNQAVAKSVADKVGPKTVAKGGASSKPAPEPKAAPNNRKSKKSSPASTSQAERASLPRVAFTVSERVVAASKSGGRSRRRARPTVKLVWPLALFGGAIALAVLSFVVSGLAGILGVVALGLAVAGLILFNQADF